MPRSQTASASTLTFVCLLLVNPSLLTAQRDADGVDEPKFVVYDGSFEFSAVEGVVVDTAATFGTGTSKWVVRPLKLRAGPSDTARVIGTIPAHRPIVVGREYADGWQMVSAIDDLLKAKVIGWLNAEDEGIADNPDPPTFSETTTGVEGTWLWFQMPDAITDEPVAGAMTYENGTIAPFDPKGRRTSRLWVSRR